MSATQTVLSVRDAGKRYRIFDRPQDRLKQMLIGSARRQYGRDFWALRGVSFELGRGERIAIIGRNGSGKSTLLQMIAGTLAPTVGEIEVRGRVAALLELGSGFNPEFSGRENVYINGAILGLSRAEVETHFDEIAAFADIGDFIDQPVKLYSSGMFVRLAFAVITTLAPDLLLIDEALAVGDVFFRQKCYRRMNELRARGCAVVLVSHSMLEVEQFCDRAVLLDKGMAIFSGGAAEAVKHYYLVEQQERTADVIVPAADDHVVAAAEAGEPPPPGARIDISSVPQVSNGWARCTAVAVLDAEGAPRRHFEQGSTARFFYEFELLRDIAVPIAGLVLQDERGVLVHGKGTLEHGTPVPTSLAAGATLRVFQSVTLDLGVGEYTFEVGLAMLGADDYAQAERLTHAALAPRIVRLCHLPAAGQITVGFRRHGHPVQLLHHGVADLPGESTVAVLRPQAAPVSTTT